MTGHGEKMDGTQRRQQRMEVLAISDIRSLTRQWALLGLDPEFTLPRPPECGLIGLRGRIGGGGDPFNFGEATVTRATVRLSSGEIGHAYVLGRDHTKAKLAAVIDALALSDADLAERIDREIVDPLRTEIRTRDEKRSQETAATRVDFFTMVRGED